MTVNRDSSAVQKKELELRVIKLAEDKSTKYFATIGNKFRIVSPDEEGGKELDLGSTTTACNINPVTQGYVRVTSLFE